MSTQMLICLIIFLLTCVGFMTGVWSLATVAMTSVAALVLFGCLPTSEALAYFSNNVVIMIGAMSVVAAGFNRTRFCSALAAGISRIAKGNFSRVLLLYCILTMLLSQMVQSPVVVFGIVAPLCMAFADSADISRSKITLALGVVSISTCCTLPIGNGATQAAELNSYILAYYDKLESFTGTIPVMGFFDPVKARLPMLVFAVFYCAFIMPRFSPDRLTGKITENKIREGDKKPPLPVFAEIAGIVIFFGTAIFLMLQASVFSSLAIWQICLTGAVAMVIFGVLKPDEAVNAVPLSMLLLVIGTLVMAGALSATGAGRLIGNFIAELVVAIRNNYIIGMIFFVFPLVLAQFMSNRGAMLICFPIAVASCHQINGDPRGLMILIEAGALTAFMTPMPTAVVPYMMEYGGYGQKDLFRGGWLFAVISCVISVGWIMTIFPVL